jgi:hypothetical protein
VLATQCLNRRLPDLATATREVAAWVARRNRQRPPIRWHFTTAQARRKLKHVYLCTTGQVSLEDRGLLKA